MIKINAQYVERSLDVKKTLFKNGDFYNLYILEGDKNKVHTADGKKSLHYHDLYDFLNDWTNIKTLK